MSGIYKGLIVGIEYESRQLRAIVIDPNGRGEGQPSMGFGLKTGSTCLGISIATLSKKLFHSEGQIYLMLSPEKILKVFEIKCCDGNTHYVLSFDDWLEVAKNYWELLIKDKRTASIEALNQMLEFMSWFASCVRLTLNPDCSLRVLTTQPPNHKDSILDQKKRDEISEKIAKEIIDKYVKYRGTERLTLYLLTEIEEFPKKPCVYFAVDTLSNIQYIGMSNNPKKRWENHHKINELTKIEGFRLLFFSVQLPLLHKVERKLIQHFNPLLNKVLYKTL